MTSVDKGATYDNVRGVFADLDDGGLTSDEALSTIRKIVGAKQPIAEVVLTGVIPVTITVNIETKTVTEFEINPGFPKWETSETRFDGAKLDEQLYAEEIAAAKEIADRDSEWPVPEVM